MITSKICMPSNAILLHKDLMDVFFDNAFGINVDVSFSSIPFLFPILKFKSCIKTIIGLSYSVTLGQQGSYWRAGILKPTFAVQRTRLGSPAQAIYFFVHTLCTLSMFICSRAISPRLFPKWNRTSFGRAVSAGRDNDEVLPFDDPRWNTEISMEIPRYRPASDAGPIGDDDVPEGIDEAANGDGSSAWLRPASIILVTAVAGRSSRSCS